MRSIFPQWKSSSFWRCRLPVSKKAPSFRCKEFSSASERRPLSWRDYFPEALDCCESGFTQRDLESPVNQTQLLSSTFPLTCKPSSKSFYDVLNFKEISPQVADEIQFSCKEKFRKVKRIACNGLAVLEDKEKPDFTDDLICILQKCKVRRDLSLAKSVHTHIRNIGLETHGAVGNHLVPLYVECGSLCDAQAVFNKLEYKNVYSWTSLLFGYIRLGELLRALELYEKMQGEGVSPSSYTLVALVKVCIALKEIEWGQRLHIQIVQKGFEGNVVVGSTLIDMYSKFYLAREAQKVFDKLSHRNVVAWSSLTAAYAESGNGPVALDCFEQMVSDGIIPNVITFLSALKACSNAGLIKRGKDIHSLIVYKGLEKELYVGNTLMDLYSKGGSLSDARNIFDCLLCRDVSSWNVMIQGYSMNHDNGSALELFETMGIFGVKPDAVTFACVLSTCSRANLLSAGQKLYERMRDIYDIVPSADHINCMVDLLARAGHVSEAEKLVNLSPNPSKDTCRALLTACRKFVKIEVGERCFNDGLSTCVMDGFKAAPTNQHLFMLP